MDYAEAVKKVQTKKEKDPFMVFKLSYDLNVVVPHKDGVSLLASLINAEQLCVPYNGQHSISEIKRDQITVSPMSREEYERYKIAALLKLSVAEVEEMAKAT